MAATAAGVNGGSYCSDFGVPVVEANGPGRGERRSTGGRG